jgi:hypothetical protein
MPLAPERLRRVLSEAVISGRRRFPPRTCPAKRIVDLTGEKAYLSAWHDHNIVIWLACRAPIAYSLLNCVRAIKVMPMRSL